MSEDRHNSSNRSSKRLEKSTQCDGSEEDDFEDNTVGSKELAVSIEDSG